MKHGIPEKEWYELCGKQYHLTKNSEALGWRRERADRVWLLVQFMVTLLFLEYRGSQDTIYLLEHCRK